MNTAGKNNALVNSLMPLNSMVKNVQTNVMNAVKKNSVMPSMPSMPSMPAGYLGYGIFAILLAVFIGLMVTYKNEIQDAWNRSMDTLSGYFNPPAPPPPAGSPAAGAKAATAPTTPVTHSTPDPASAQESQDLVNKILPTSGREVFSVSANKFTYNDAEPLCKALGAELATYEQVKEAWGKGADWCNYGWVKGQMAVYPTQKETWEKAQAGSEDQRMSCGNPGMNGGFFDNPELRFGVTCYGQKPDQSKHDEDRVASIPKSPASLDFDKKVAVFRSEADHMGVLPFNTGKWNSS
jgi:hypothetical protein